MSIPLSFCVTYRLLDLIETVGSLDCFVLETVSSYVAQAGLTLGLNHSFFLRLENLGLQMNASCSSILCCLGNNDKANVSINFL